MPLRVVASHLISPVPGDNHEFFLIWTPTRSAVGAEILRVNGASLAPLLEKRNCPGQVSHRAMMS